MFDISLRPLKDKLFDPCCSYVPASIKPLHVTIFAFLFGLLSCYFAATKPTSVSLSLLFWALNRALDCLDGALARHRGTTSDLGGFLDLLGDFTIYSLLPIAIARGSAPTDPGTFMAIAALEATFHVNNFILFYLAAVTEKAVSEQREGDAKGKDKKKELTSVMMRPALVEGMESGLIFTAMLGFPDSIRELSWTMSGLVAFGIIQRSAWAIGALQ
ncbi:MAG: hypothetical protein Q9212_000929 [Teloschistes hypoglaucus]